MNLNVKVQMEEQAVRWSLKVSKETDLNLRTFLGSQGMKKGDLSKFVEDAVNRRLLQCTVQDIWARNADANPDEIQRIVDGAVSEVRAERRTKEKADKA
jgi:Ribbon-helix-helix domain